MKPTIQELAQQLTGKVMVAELNVDQNLIHQGEVSGQPLSNGIDF